jgi:hypothetical protein
MDEVGSGHLPGWMPQIKKTRTPLRGKKKDGWLLIFLYQSPPRHTLKRRMYESWRQTSLVYRPQREIHSSTALGHVTFCGQNAEPKHIPYNHSGLHASFA